MHKKTALVLLILFVITSCNLPTASVLENVSQSRNIFWVTKDPNGIATPTPFMPMTIDATEVPQSTPTNLPDPTQIPPTPTSTETPINQVNILILGSDYREGRGYRTDVFMLLSLYPDSKTASIISFPRDLYVFIPGVGNQRINVAQPYGGFELTNATLKENFGVSADHYIMTNFNGFKSIIDSLGGINVEVGNYLSDQCSLPQADSAGYCTVYPGAIFMNGETALWYVRSRYSTSDLDRTRRAQEVMVAIFSRLMSLDAISRIPELFAAYSYAVETDLSIEDIVPLAPLASSLLSDLSKLRRYAIGIDQVTPYVLPDSGANVLLPNYEAIAELIRQSAFTP